MSRTVQLKPVISTRNRRVVKITASEGWKRTRLSVLKPGTATRQTDGNVYSVDTGPGFLTTGESWLRVGLCRGCVVCCALWSVFPRDLVCSCYLQRLHYSRVSLCDRSLGTLHYICLQCIAILGMTLIPNAFHYKYMMLQEARLHWLVFCEHYNTLYIRM